MCLWIGRHDIVKMTILPKVVIYRLNPYQSPNDFYFSRNRKINPKIPMQFQGAPNILIFDRGIKAILWGKENLFNQWCWENWISIQKYEVEPLLDTIYKKLTQNASRT